MGVVVETDIRQRSRQALDVASLSKLTNFQICSHPHPNSRVGLFQSDSNESTPGKSEILVLSHNE